MQPNRQAQNQGASGHQRNNNNNNNQANNAVVLYNSQQANRGRGNNNDFRGRGNNRANYQQWNIVDSQRHFQVSTPEQTSANRGFSNLRGRGRGNWQPRHQYNNPNNNYNNNAMGRGNYNNNARAPVRQPAYQQQSFEQQP
jgi:hypothetical protein